jgi:Ca-activated chloride channel family protein
MDVSRSVDPKEFQLIKHGTADAFRNREIIDLIALMKQGAFVTVVQWSGPDQNRQMVPWSKLGPKQATLDFADKIDAMVRYYRYGLTAPGEALAYANQLFSDLPTPCKRKVIDISGDGIRNIGLPARSVADTVEAQDVIINGLVVRGDTPDPLEFYQTEIKRGPLGFIQIAKGYDDFPRAMFLKLLRELSPSLSYLRP